MKTTELLKKDLSKKPKCTECDGSGKISKGRTHYPCIGWEVTCDYCRGTGKIYWAKNITKRDLIKSAKEKLTLEEQKAVGLI